MNNKPRILIIAFSGRIGDTLLMTPAIKAIANKFPDHYIHVLAHKNRYYLLSELQFIDKIGIISRRMAFFKGRHYCRTYDFGFVFAAPGEQPCSNFINYANRICKKTAAQTSDSDMWVSSPTYKKGQHVIDYFMQLPRDCGIGDKDRHISYTVSDGERNTAILHLQNIIPHGSLIVGLQLSSFGTRSYRDWPLDYYKDLCIRLINTGIDIHFAIIGTEQDKQKAQYLASVSTEYIHDCTGISIRPTAAIMSLLNLYIGPDTGPSHIMSAFGKPMIVLYHCLHPSSQFSPTINENMAVIDMPVGTACSASRSMADITVDVVYSHACTLLGISEDKK